MSHINVNLAACTFYGVCNVRGAHIDKCPGKPVLVPLPLEPWRTVRMKVRLGECRCINKDRADDGLHAASCPARPIEVTCSIGGKDWPSSEATEVERSVNDDHIMGDHRMGLLADACRSLWDVVRAMLTNPGLRITGWAGSVAMYETRDAVYAAICEMARHEDAHAQARQHAYDAMDASGHIADSEHVRARITPRESSVVLAAYVQRLIEQVGSL